jgi:hypothetical protein
MTVPRFDAARFHTDELTVFRRFNRYGGLRGKDNPELHEALQSVLTYMRRDGEKHNKHTTPVLDSKRKKAVDNAVRILDEHMAFEVRADFWAKAQKQKNFVQLLQWASTVHPRGLVAWSKTTGFPAEERALAMDGLTLEYTVPGSAFDGMKNGFDPKYPSPTLGYLWNRMSETTMSKGRGQMHADIFEAVDKSSVMYRSEIDVIKGLIDKGLVSGLTVHVRVRDPQSRRLMEKQTVDVHSRESLDTKLPAWEGSPAQVQRQAEEYGTQQVRRALLRNRNGMQQSVTDLFHAMDEDRDNTVVFVTSQREVLSPWLGINDEDFRRLNGPLFDVSPTQRLYNNLVTVAQRQVRQGGSATLPASPQQLSPLDSPQQGSPLIQAEPYTAGEPLDYYGPRTGSDQERTPAPASSFDMAEMQGAILSASHGGSQLPAVGQMLNYQPPHPFNQDRYSGVPFTVPNYQGLPRPQNDSASISPNTSYPASYRTAPTSQGSYHTASSGGSHEDSSQGSGSSSPSASSAANPTGSYLTGLANYTASRAYSPSPPSPSGASSGSGSPERGTGHGR